MAEATVVYHAIADFAQLRKEVKQLRREIRELEAEQAAFNAAQNKIPDEGIYKRRTRAIKDEAKATDDAAKSVREYVQGTLASERAKRKQIKAIEEKTVADQEEAEAIRAAVKAAKEQEKAERRLAAAVREAQRQAKEAQREEARLARERDKASQEALRAYRAQAREARRLQQEEINRQRAIIRELERSAAARRRDGDEAVRQQRRRSSLPPIGPDGNLRGGTRRRAGGGGSGGGTPSVADPDPGGRGARSLANLIGKANAATRSMMLLWKAIGLLLGIASIIGPAIATLSALGSAALGVVGAFSQMSGAILALPGVIAAGVLAIGTLVVALRGMMKVFQAYTQQQEAEKAAAKTRADAQRQSARAIADAQRSLRRAREDAARSAVDAAERVADAERSLARSQRAVTEAQKDLNKARQQALKDLIDLREEVARGSLNEEQAVAALKRAQEEYQRVLAEPGSTDADKLSALADLHQAEQDLTDVRRTRSENESELAKAEKKGIENSDLVLNAKQDIRDANENLADSERNLVDAQEDQAYNAQQSAERIADAQRNLAEAYEDAAAAQAGASANLHAFDDALKKLSPSAQKFVKGIIAMKDEWEKLRKTVQEAFFKSIVTQLDNIRKSLPFVEENLARVAEALGLVFTEWIKWITSPEMRPFFKYLSESTARIIKTLGPAFLSTFQAFVALIKGALPFIERFAKTFAKSATGFKDWAEGAESSGKLAGIFEKAGQRISEFWTITKNLLGAFRNLLSAADDFNDWLIGGLVKGTQNFEDFTAAQKLEGSPFKKYLEDIKPLLQETGQLAKDFIGFIFAQSADPKNISQAIEILRKLRKEFGPAFTRFINAVRDTDLILKFIDVITAVTSAFASLIEKGGGEGMKIFLGFLKEMFEGLQWMIDNTPDEVITALSVAFGVLATLKFTGLMALLRALSGGRTLGALSKLALAMGATGTAGALASSAAGGGGVLNRPTAETAPIPMAGPLLPGQERQLVARTQTKPMVGPMPVDPKTGKEMARPMVTSAIPVKTERTPFGEKVDEFTNALMGAWKWISKIGKAIGRLFGPDVIEFWDMLKSKAKKAFEEIGPEVAKLGDTLKDLWAILKPVVYIVGTILLAAFKILANVFKNVVGVRLDFIIGQIKSLLQIFRGVVKFIAGLVTGDWKKAWDGLVLIFKGTWNLIINFLKNIPMMLWGIIKGIVEGIVEFFKWLWDELVGNSIIPDLINDIVDWFKKLPGMILDALKKLPGLLFDGAKKMLTGLWNGLKWVWENVLWPWIKALPGNFIRGLGNLLEMLLETGKKILRGLWNGIKWLWDNVLWPWIKNFPSNFLKGLGDLLNMLLEAGKKILRGLYNGAKWLWENVLWPWIKNIPSNFLKGLGTLKDTLYNAGKTLLQGLWNGVKAVWKAMTSWLSGTVKSGFTNLFKDPISFLIDTVVNKWIIGAINKLPFVPDISPIANPFRGNAGGGTKTQVEGGRAGGRTFAVGGRVPGTGDQDTVPAMLTPGEFVIRKRAVKALGIENLEELNQVRGYGIGGLVGGAWAKVKGVAKGASGVFNKAAGVGKAAWDKGSKWARGAVGSGFEKLYNSKLKGIVHALPQILGVPGGLSDWAVAKVVSWIKGSEKEQQETFDGPAGPAQLIGPSIPGDGSRTTDRGARAINWMRGQSGSNADIWFRKCLMLVRTALGVPAKNASATEGWYDTEMRMGTGTPPPGVPVWWTGGQWGHVALSDGAGYAWSNDKLRKGMVDRVPISSFSRDWGFDYKGWTRDINDVQVYRRGGQVKSNPRNRGEINPRAPFGMSKEDIRKNPQNLGYAFGGPVLPSFLNGGGSVMDSSYSLASVPASIQNRSSDRSMTFGDINITNPRPEPASDSLPRSIRKLSYLGQG